MNYNAIKKPPVKSPAKDKNTFGRTLKSKVKKKKPTVKPNLYTMSLVWILAVFIIAAIFLKIRHFVIAHW
jgi:hypothetical protein